MTYRRLLVCLLYCRSLSEIIDLFNECFFMLRYVVGNFRDINLGFVVWEILFHVLLIFLDEWWVRDFVRGALFVDLDERVALFRGFNNRCLFLKLLMRRNCIIEIFEFIQHSLSFIFFVLIINHIFIEIKIHQFIVIILVGISIRGNQRQSIGVICLRHVFFVILSLFLVDFLWVLGLRNISEVQK